MGMSHAKRVKYLKDLRKHVERRDGTPSQLGIVSDTVLGSRRKIKTVHTCISIAWIVIGGSMDPTVKVCTKQQDRLTHHPVHHMRGNVFVVEDYLPLFLRFEH